MVYTASATNQLPVVIATQYIQLYPIAHDTLIRSVLGNYLSGTAVTSRDARSILALAHYGFPFSDVEVLVCSGFSVRSDYDAAPILPALDIETSLN
jgi:hypothetical protein